MNKISSDRKKLSIIIPIYNVEKYLSDCLDSIKKLDPTEFEVICVNDGSTDNSKEIAQRYVNENPELISLYTKANGGLSDARNYGLDQVTGEYVTFLDSDDWVNAPIYTSMLTTAYQKDADVVVCNYVEYTDGDEVLVSDNNIGDKIVYEAMVCNKIFKTCLFNDNAIRFPIGLHYEDNLTCYILLGYSNHIVKLDETLYYYRQMREGQITSQFNDKIYDINKIGEQLYEGFKPMPTYNDLASDLELLFIRNIMFRTLPKIVRLNRIHIFKSKKEIWKEYQFLESYFPDWYLNESLKKDDSGYFKGKLGKGHVKKIRALKYSLVLLVLFAMSGKLYSIRHKNPSIMMVKEESKS
ncbi:hypothetical protein AOC36_08495 [Erysipelothrix larvae]|uniref:Glycosyltransferase 2-like domain-containing protein n=1 Tax=Erysipelothrix larvae TaxID=1514105 RepID=A0A109UHE1_9FIRM|nr:glycosyltransferase [Erysipelothrix larvae]AMC94023.1 hypothetical protein AOC36_08495 [Erysipelothrix larvae]